MDSFRGILDQPLERSFRKATWRFINWSALLVGLGGLGVAVSWIGTPAQEIDDLLVQNGWLPLIDGGVVERLPVWVQAAIASAVLVAAYFIVPTIVRSVGEILGHRATSNTDE